MPIKSGWLAFGGRDCRAPFQAFEQVTWWSTSIRASQQAVLHVGDLAMRAGSGRSGPCRRGLVGWLSSDDGWGPDRVLDLEELIGIRLALGANEDVAILVARTATAQTVTDNANLDRGRHSTIFAQSPEAGVWVATIDAPSVEQYAVVGQAQSCRFRAALRPYR